MDGGDARLERLQRGDADREWNPKGELGPHDRWALRDPQPQLGGGGVGQRLRVHRERAVGRQPRRAVGRLAHDGAGARRARAQRPAVLRRRDVHLQCNVATLGGAAQPRPRRRRHAPRSRRAQPRGRRGARVLLPLRGQGGRRWRRRQLAARASDLRRLPERRPHVREPGGGGGRDDDGGGRAAGVEQLTTVGRRLARLRLLRAPDNRADRAGGRPHRRQHADPRLRYPPPRRPQGRAPLPRRRRWRRGDGFV